MTTIFNTEQARYHYVHENGWTPAEWDALIGDIGARDRTEEEWHTESAAWARENIDGTPTPPVTPAVLRKTLTVTIDLESAALADGFADHELAAMLRTLATRIERGGLSSPEDVLTVGEDLTIRDINGVNVGAARVVEVAR